MKGLNFKDWTKLSEDKKCTTLQHSKGHIMTIYHFALPKIQQEQLKRIKMAGGGTAEKEQKTIGQQINLPGSDPSPQPEKKPNYTEAGPMSGYKEGGAVASWTKREDNEKGINKGEHVSSAGMHVRASHENSIYADDGHDKEESIGAAKLTHKKVLKEMHEMPKSKLYSDVPELIGPDDNAPVESEAIDPKKLENQAPTAPQPAPSSPYQQTSVGNAPTTPLEQEAQRQIGTNYNAGVEAATQQKPIDVANAQAKETQFAGQQKIDQQAAQNYQKAFSAVNNFHAALNTYQQQNPISPNQYVQKMNSTDKGQALSAIGLILGGVGAAKNGVNPAADFLNKQIDRNVAAQQQNFENKKSVFGAAQQIFGDHNIATNLAKVSLYDQLINQTNQVAAQQQTPQAEVNRLKAVSDFTAKSNEALMNAAKLLQANPPAYEQMVNKMGQGQPVPGGQSSQAAPVPSEATHGADANWSSVNPKDHLLNDNAYKVYHGLSTGALGMTRTPSQLADIERDFKNADQTDKAIDEINSTYPELMKKRTYGGWISNHASALGTIAGAGLEGAGIVGAGPTAGASLLGGIAGSAALGAATAGGAKILGNAIGGKDQIDYETAASKLLPIIEAALARSGGMTPTDAHATALQYLPTKFDNDDTSRNKMESLKEKLRMIAQTSVLKDNNMLREQGLK